MFSNIIRKNVHTWNTPSSLKWFVRTICWSRSSAAGKGFFWIPSPGRRRTGAATSRESGVPQHMFESQKRQAVNQNAQSLLWLHWGRDCPGVAEIVKTEPRSQMTWPLTKWQWQYEYEWQLWYYLISLLFVLLLILVYYSHHERDEEEEEGEGEEAEEKNNGKQETWGNLVKAAAWAKSSSSSTSEVCHSGEHRGIIPKAASLDLAKCRCEFGVRLWELRRGRRVNWVLCQS